MPANAVRKHPLPLRGIAARGQGAKFKYALDNTAMIIAAEEAYFGTPYPFDKLDLLAAPDFASGAMENPGLIVYRDSALFVDEKSRIGARQYFWNAHAHELAHQWFGNLVTMPWWDDLWLNESFASWFASKIIAEVQPALNAERGQVESSVRTMGGDSLATTRRVREPITTFTDIQSGFDGITYSKGGAVLAMFERQLGADRFRDGMRQYMAKHARGNATSDDLIEALAAVSEDPATFRKAFRSFLDQPGVPLLSVQTQCDGGSPQLRIEQQRYLPVGSPVAAAGEWTVPMCVRYDDGKGGLHEQCNLVAGNPAIVPLETKSCPSFVMPNADGAGYYRFTLNAKDQAALQANFDRLNEREQRVFADSITAAYAAGTIDTPAFLRAAADLAKAPEASTALAPVSRIAVADQQRGQHAGGKAGAARPRCPTVCAAPGRARHAAARRRERRRPLAAQRADQRLGRNRRSARLARAARRAGPGLARPVRRRRQTRRRPVAPRMPCRWKSAAWPWPWPWSPATPRYSMRCCATSRPARIPRCARRCCRPPARRASRNWPHAPVTTRCNRRTCAATRWPC